MRGIASSAASGHDGGVRRHQGAASMTCCDHRLALANADVLVRRGLICLLAGMIATVVCFGSTSAAAEDIEIAHRRAAERKNFTDAEIIDGFFKVTFGAEFHV